MLGFSQFYILSRRGDVIVNRDYRDDIPGSSQEEFFRKVKFWDEDDTISYSTAPPIFQIDGLNFAHLKTSNLYFVVTTRFNISPAYAVSFLTRVSKIFEDYCGVLNEESLRKNFILIYELLDEILDYGYPQLTFTESLKATVHNEPILIQNSTNSSLANLSALSLSNFQQIQKATTPSTAVHKPVLSRHTGSSKNEVFVDVIEKLTVVFHPDGYTLNSEINGRIQLKNYLHGNPSLKLALNDDLRLEDCNFHRCVNLDEFETMRLIKFLPPEGEFVVMNYRLTGEFIPPFRITPRVEQESFTEIAVEVFLSVDLPEAKFASNIEISCPLGSNKQVAATSVKTYDLSNLHLRNNDANSSTKQKAPNVVHQQAEYREKDGQLVWTVKKALAGQELKMKASITLKNPDINNQFINRIGPVSATFDVPMHNVSHLKVRYLRIQSNTSGGPEVFRWVRYMTNSDSYTARIQRN